MFGIRNNVAKSPVPCQQLCNNPKSLLPYHEFLYLIYVTLDHGHPYLPTAFSISSANLHNLDRSLFTLSSALCIRLANLISPYSVAWLQLVCPHQSTVCPVPSSPLTWTAYTLPESSCSLFVVPCALLAGTLPLVLYTLTFI
jgi:hypothetical protein